jgi:hypothetical protein
LAAGLVIVMGLYQQFVQHHRHRPGFAYEAGPTCSRCSHTRIQSAWHLTVLALALVASAVLVSLASVSATPDALDPVSGERTGGVSIHSKNGATPDWIAEFFARNHSTVGSVQVSISI